MKRLKDFYHLSTTTSPTVKENKYLIINIIKRHAGLAKNTITPEIIVVRPGVIKRKMLRNKKLLRRGSSPHC